MRVRHVGVASERRCISTARFVASPSDRTPPPSSSRTDGQRLPMVGAWSVNPRHAVVSHGADWLQITRSAHLSGPRVGGLAGSPKASLEELEATPARKL